MYAEISAAMTSVKAALSIAKSANELANYNELVAAISEVNTKLMDATTVALASQEKQSTLSNRVAELENQLREIENWEGKIERYELHQFPTGTFAYSLKGDSESGEPHHYLCATCVNEKKPTILQPHGTYVSCPVCDKHIQVCPSPPGPTKANSGHRFRR
jgi:hypothetical protein